MKRTTKNVMLAAVLTMAASTVLSAQSMRAEIPFSFRAGNGVMGPGSYEVTAAPGEHWFVLRNFDDRKAVIVLAGPGEDAPRAWKDSGTGMLQFACSEGTCNLLRLWSGEGSQSHVFSVPKTVDGRPARLAVIRLVAAQK
jgi:hypothetical protein